ncbi:MAG: hypothetical protein AAF696_36155 [Bacteroidota bacterium]
MKLLYLSEANLKDRLLIRDLVFNYKFEEKAILIHDQFGGKVSDTRFVNKRISALLSEAMVYNNAFSADQRIFISQEGAKLIPNKERIEQILYPIQLLVVAPIIKAADKAILTDALGLLKSVREAYEIEEVILFANNPLSPMVSQAKRISTEEDRDKLLKVYEEEAESLDLAYQLRPAILASPQNYSKALS